MANSGRSLVLAQVVAVKQGSLVYPCCFNCYSKIYSTTENNRTYWQCLKCGSTYSKDVNYRYRLGLVICDNTLQCVVTVFGTTLEPFLGCSAAEFARLTGDADKEKELLVQDAVEKVFVGGFFMFGFKTASVGSTQSEKHDHLPLTLAAIIKASTITHKPSEDDQTLPQWSRQQTMVAYQMIHAGSSHVNHNEQTVVSILRNKSMRNNENQPGCTQVSSDRPLPSMTFTESPFEQVNTSSVSYRCSLTATYGQGSAILSCERGCPSSYSDDHQSSDSPGNNKPELNYSYIPYQSSSALTVSQTGQRKGASESDDPVLSDPEQMMDPDETIDLNEFSYISPKRFSPPSDPVNNNPFVSPSDVQRLKANTCNFYCHDGPNDDCSIDGEENSPLEDSNYYFKYFKEAIAKPSQIRQQGCTQVCNQDEVSISVKARINFEDGPNKDENTSGMLECIAHVSDASMSSNDSYLLLADPEPYNLEDETDVRSKSPLAGGLETFPKVITQVDSPDTKSRDRLQQDANFIRGASTNTKTESFNSTKNNLNPVSHHNKSNSGMNTVVGLGSASQTPSVRDRANSKTEDRSTLDSDVDITEEPLTMPFSEDLDAFLADMTFSQQDLVKENSAQLTESSEGAKPPVKNSIMVREEQEDFTKGFNKQENSASDTVLVQESQNLPIGKQGLRSENSVGAITITNTAKESATSTAGPLCSETNRFVQHFEECYTSGCDVSLNDNNDSPAAVDSDALDRSSDHCDKSLRTYDEEDSNCGLLVGGQGSHDDVLPTGSNIIPCGGSLVSECLQYRGTEGEMRGKQCSSRDNGNKSMQHAECYRVKDTPKSPQYSVENVSSEESMELFSSPSSLFTDDEDSCVISGSDDDHTSDVCRNKKLSVVVNPKVKVDINVQKNNPAKVKNKMANEPFGDCRCIATVERNTRTAGNSTGYLEVIVETSTNDSSSSDIVGTQADLFESLDNSNTSFDRVQKEQTAWATKGRKEEKSKPRRKSVCYAADLISTRNIADIDSRMKQTPLPQRSARRRSCLRIGAALFSSQQSPQFIENTLETQTHELPSSPEVFPRRPLMNGIFHSTPLVMPKDAAGSQPLWASENLDISCSSSDTSFCVPPSTKVIRKFKKRISLKKKLTSPVTKLKAKFIKKNYLEYQCSRRVCGSGENKENHPQESDSIDLFSDTSLSLCDSHVIKPSQNRNYVKKGVNSGVEIEQSGTNIQRENEGVLLATTAQNIRTSGLLDVSGELSDDLFSDSPWDNDTGIDDISKKLF